LAAAASVFVLVGHSGDDRKTFNSGAVSNGWVAFAVTDVPSENGIYVVRQGGSPRRVAGSAGDQVERRCPAFSPDGRRLVYGQSTPIALVVANVRADGTLADAVTFPVNDSSPPCGIWSPDGRWIAFGAGDTDDHTQPVETVFGVNLVDTETGAVRVLPSGRPVSDLAWSPDGTKLALADGGIAVYSLATGEVRHLIDGTRVQTLDWSPDGRRIAFDRVDPAAIPPPEPAVSDARQLAIIDADGTDERIIASGYHANQGIGPVWSPDGNRIVYQRVCDRRTLPAGVPYTCREAHEVVVASLDQTAGQGVTQVLIPPPETADAGGSTVWWPFYVTWSPDGETLLYQAWPDPTLPRCDVNQGCIALLAVLADGNGTATILTGDLEVGLDREPGVPTQSWGRQPPD
jgi:Tol biopolymer transport system component